jgi:AcrR family transcriptional regulator
VEAPVATEEVVSIRQHILDAAEQVIQDLGMKCATTREIARRAGCAEGSIYRYFPDKQALFHEIVKTRFPQFLDLIETLPGMAGTGTVRKNLEAVAVNALGFYRVIVPIVVGAISDHELLRQQRRHFEERNGGPLKAIRLVSTYLCEERKLGRLSGQVSPEHATRLLLGACFSQALMEALIGEEARVGTDQQFARDIVRTLMTGAESGLTDRAPGIDAGRRRMHRADP